MKFGVREICDVVLKAKAKQKIGNKTFFKNEPVIYFDTLKTSSMEGAATTVYAQGGRGNSRLMAWEGERTVTFTMEDALISPAGFMILSGAGLIQGSEDNKIKVHRTEQTDEVDIGTDSVDIILSEKPYTETGDEKYIYVMLLDDGEVVTEPYIPQAGVTEVYWNKTSEKWEDVGTTGKDAEGYKITIDNTNNLEPFSKAKEKDPTVVVLVDYYVEKSNKGTYQIEITPDKFGGNYYLEASTLFRSTNGVDMPAEFIIPNCKIQSNFSFTMASSGDPSTFTFTIDAFPDYTRFDKKKKVLAAIQVIESETGENDEERVSTEFGYTKSGT